MSVQKALKDYHEVTRCYGNKVCHKCGEKIKYHAPYLHLRRNRHIFIVCGACVMLYSKQVMELDPDIKYDVAEKLIESEVLAEDV